MPRVFGTPDDDFFPGSLEPDGIDGRTGADYIFGGGGANTLRGSAGNDALSGYDEPDLLCGRSRNDELYGGNQDDRLMGGAGRDVLMGQAGVDFLKGCFGDDTFVFIIEAPGNVPTADSGVGEGNRDVIEDFRPGRETIDLSNYTRYRGPYQTSDAPVFLGKAAFTDSDVLHVRYDVQEDGDAVVQFLGPRPIGIEREGLLGEIELKNVGELTVETFLLGPAASDAPLGLEGDGRRGLRPDGGGSPSLRRELGQAMRA
jgi:Ca2+-binding RTX toxin-like protein